MDNKYKKGLENIRKTLEEEKEIFEKQQKRLQEQIDYIDGEKILFRPYHCDYCQEEIKIIEPFVTLSDWKNFKHYSRDIIPHRFRVYHRKCFDKI